MLAVRQGHRARYVVIRRRQIEDRFARIDVPVCTFPDNRFCFTRSPNDSPTIDFPSREGSGKGVQCRDPSYEPRDCASNHFRFAGGSGQPPISRGFTRRLDDSNAIAQASREASGRIAHPNLHRVKIGLRPARCDASRRNASKIGRAEIRPHRDPATHRHCSISVSSGNVSMLAIIRIS
jgi:hypothetical protein